MAISAKEIIKRAAELRSRKNNWENRAQVCAKYCLPHKANITEKSEQGDGVDIDVYDSTAIDAAQIAAAGLQAFLCSPSARWFEAEFEDPELNNDSNASEWLQKEVEGIYDILNNSNFNQQIGEFFHDFVVLPGATMHSEEDPDSVIRFTNIPFDEVLIGLNSKGEVDELFRAFKYTVKQIVDKWGFENVGEEIQKLFKENKLDTERDILHAVGPRYVRIIGKNDSKNMPFYDCYVDVKTKKKLSEKGYKTFPYFVGRWRVNTGEDWGYSPAMIAISDILMLNEMQKILIESGSMAVAPPWLLPDENFVLPLNFNPHGINYRTFNSAGKTQSERDPIPLVSKANIPIGLDMVNAQAERIKRYFFTDLFLPLLDKTATAFEVAKVIEKRMTILGSVVGGLTKYVLEPIIIRTMKIRREHPQLQGKLAPIPGIIKDGEKVRINYISPLATAQKAILTQNLEAFLFSVGQMMQINPEVRHKVKWDKAVDKMARIKSIDKDLLSSDSEFEQLVTAERQARAQQAQLEQAAAGARILKEGGQGAAQLKQNGLA